MAIGSLSLKTINDDFVALAKENDIIQEISKHEMINSNDQSVKEKKTLTLSPTKKLFQDKLLLKILNAFQSIVNIKTLDLSGNVFTEESAQKLASVLASSTELQLGTLLLENCSLRNEGITVIANSLKNVKTLKCLDLSSNSISEVDHIIQILKDNTGLEHLNIEKNCLCCAAGNKVNLAIANLMKLKALGIDQNFICLVNTIANVDRRKIFVYNHDHQRTEVIELRGSFNNINSLTLCKIPIVAEHQPMITFILDNGSVMLWWSQCGELNTSGVLRFISSLKKITTIKLLNNSGSELTELEVDTIATVISKNVQLQKCVAR